MVLGFPCNWVHSKTDSDLVSFRIDAPCFCYAGLMGGREHDFLASHLPRRHGTFLLLGSSTYSTTSTLPYYERRVRGNVVKERATKDVDSKSR